MAYRPLTTAERQCLPSGYIAASPDGPIAAPCPVCGEAEMLQAHDGYDEWIAQDESGEVIREDGEAAVEVYTAAECQVCCAVMPLQVWNGWRPSSACRDGYIRYLCEPEPEAARAQEATPRRRAA